MAFPRKLLGENEEIVLDLHPHWWFLIGPLVALVAALALGITLGVSDLSDALKIVGAALVLGALLWFLGRYARWVTTSFVVTTDRLIYRYGVVSKHGIEIPLERVNTVFFRQSLFERILRAGDLVIESAGEQRQSFQDVRRPSAVQNEIYHQMEANENRKFDRIAAQRAPGSPEDADSIPAQIRQLDELRRQGVLSDVEFAHKKRELLDRM